MLWQRPQLQPCWRWGSPTWTSQQSLNNNNNNNNNNSNNNSSNNNTNNNDDYYNACQPGLPYMDQPTVTQEANPKQCLGRLHGSCIQSTYRKRLTAQTHRGMVSVLHAKTHSRGKSRAAVASTWKHYMAQGMYAKHSQKQSHCSDVQGHEC